MLRAGGRKAAPTRASWHGFDDDLENAS